MTDRLAGGEVADVVLLTGPAGLGGGKSPGDTLWMASIGVAAWLPVADANTGTPVPGAQERLFTYVDDDELGELRTRLPADSVVTARVRRRRDEDPRPAAFAFELLEMLPPVPSTVLEAVLAESLRPVLLTDDVLGTLERDRVSEVFETTGAVRLSFPDGPDEVRAAGLATTRLLFAALGTWEAAAREAAVAELFALKNDNWLADDEEPLTEAQFLARLTLTAVTVDDPDEFTFWFDDGDLFFGHVVCVSGSLADGFTDATIAG